jgi:glycine/D-amino acid oxidase-like deaminating enzyme
MTEANNPFDPAITSGRNESYWSKTAPSLGYGTLDADKAAEVVVIGAGISGLTTAYCLLQAGRNVIVLEDGNIGSGETGRTTAHLTCALDDRYYDIREIFGKEKAALAARSHMEAIDWIEERVAR